MNEPSIKRAKKNPPQRIRKEIIPEQQREQEYGEGNYKAAREYDEAAKAFAHSDKVAAAAAAAKPKNAKEAAEMASAEARGRSKAKQ
jgi:hypothetical protein